MDFCAFYPPLTFQRAAGCSAFDAGACPGSQRFRPGIAEGRRGVQTSESPDVVRRRGRWITYIQEIGALLYLPRLDSDHRGYIFAWANSFGEALEFAALCTRWRLPRTGWHYFLQHGALMPVNNGNALEDGGVQFNRLREARHVPHNEAENGDMSP